MLARAPPVAPPVAPADPRAVAVEPNDPKTADKQTLAEFASLHRAPGRLGRARRRSSPTGRRPRRCARSCGSPQENNNAFLGAAGELKMKDLRVVIASQRDPLAAYGKAVSEAGWTPAHDGQGRRPLGRARRRS